jgi:hypothetical protein
LPTPDLPMREHPESRSRTPGAMGYRGARAKRCASLYEVQWNSCSSAPLAYESQVMSMQLPVPALRNGSGELRSIPFHRLLWEPLQMLAGLVGNATGSTRSCSRT